MRGSSPPADKSHEGSREEEPHPATSSSKKSPLLTENELLEVGGVESDSFPEIQPQIQNNSTNKSDNTTTNNTTSTNIPNKFGCLPDFASLLPQRFSTRKFALFVLSFVTCVVLGSFVVLEMREKIELLSLQNITFAGVRENLKNFVYNVDVPEAFREVRLRQKPVVNLPMGKRVNEKKLMSELKKQFNTEKMQFVVNNEAFKSDEATIIRHTKYTLKHKVT
jgi:hypothetical protein